MFGKHTLFLTASLALAHWCNALVSDVPGLNGPIPPTRLSDIEFGKRLTREFNHPGIWHTHDDLELIRTSVERGLEPWASTFAAFRADSYSLATYNMQGPHSVISRGGISNQSSLSSDSRAAYHNSIMWYVTRDQAHWTRATTILDAWGSNLTNIIGTDRSLLVALEGQFLVNAAEIMRWEGNWTETGASWRGGSGFSVQLYWLFARQSIPNGHANYGMASVSALLSFAVYLDDVNMYNYALDLYQNDYCAGIYGNVDPTTGQGSEAGRDQSHAQSALAWAATAARTVRSQGGDLAGFGDNALLKGAEYAAKYNLNYTVTYDPKYYRCLAVLVNGPWPTISDISRGLTRPVWDLLYYTFVKGKGLRSPYLEEAFLKAPQERRFTSADLPSWGDLLWATGKASNCTRRRK